MTNDDQGSHCAAITRRDQIGKMFVWCVATACRTSGLRRGFTRITAPEHAEGSAIHVWSYFCMSHHK